MLYNTKQPKIVEMDALKKNMSFEGDPWYIDLQLNNMIQARNAPKIFVFDINPNIKPNNIGDLWVNKTLGTAYIATNVLVTADRKIIT